MQLSDRKIDIKYSLHDLGGLHRVLIIFINEIDRFFKENEITYYLMGGTALGAIRHGGFIPWDDDFDIFLDRKNYLKFLAISKTMLDKEKFHVQDENSDDWPLFFSKIRLNNTLYIENLDDVGKIHCGIYIDVMCLNNVYENKFMRYAQFLSARILTAMALSRRGYSTKSWLKKFALAIAKILQKTPAKNILLSFVLCLQNIDTKYVGHFFGRAKFVNTCFLRKYLGTPRLIRFENTVLPVPNKVEDYLTVRFGVDYMKMPSTKVIQSFPSHLLYFDLGPYS